MSKRGRFYFLDMKDKQGRKGLTFQGQVLMKILYY
jgi:hypothetical protein